LEIHFGESKIFEYRSWRFTSAKVRSLNTEVEDSFSAKVTPFQL